MFFFFSKTLDVLLSPLSWAILCVAIGGLIAWRRPAKRAAWMSPLALSALVLWVFSLDSVANALERRLELSARDTYDPSVTYDGVVVLGGMVDNFATDASKKRNYSESFERLIAGFDLIRAGKAREVFISGGFPDAPPEFANEARVLGDQLADWGIPREKIIVDTMARNTRENAINAAKVSKERGWKSVVMVTSAFHMQRAKECFNAVGLPVATLPVDYRSYDSEKHTGRWFPRAENLAVSSGAIREAAGRVIYRLQGYARP